MLKFKLFFIAAAIFTSIITLKAEDQIFYNYELGLGIMSNVPSEQVNDFNLNYSSCISVGVPFFITVKNNFGHRMSSYFSSYSYHISDYSSILNHPDYYILNNDGNHFTNTKISVFLGMGYKIRYKRLTVIPYFDLGYICKIQGSFSDQLLKENNSNKIISITTAVRNESSAFDYTFGANLYFRIIQDWGIVASMRYDRFNPISEFTTIVDDYNSEQEETSDKIKFNHNNLIFSVGFYWQH